MTLTSERAATVLNASDALRLYWRPVADGVRAKVLASAGDDAAAILLVEPDAAFEPHVHDGAHHMYVLEGRCWFGDALLTEGAYVFVPAGTPHTLHGAGPTGCRLLYVGSSGAVDPAP